MWPAWGLQVFCWFFFFFSSFWYIFDVFGWEFFPFLPIFFINVIFLSIRLFMFFKFEYLVIYMKLFVFLHCLCLIWSSFYICLFFFGAHYWVTITYRLLHFYAFWNNSYFCVSVFLTYGYHYIFWKLHSKYLEGACVPVWMGMMLLSVRGGGSYCCHVLQLHFFPLILIAIFYCSVLRSPRSTVLHYARKQDETTWELKENWCWEGAALLWTIPLHFLASQENKPDRAVIVHFKRYYSNWRQWSGLIWTTAPALGY